MSWVAVIVLVVGSSAQLAEAKKAAPAKPAPPTAPTAASAPAEPKKKPGPPPDKATSAKVNAYIELMNAESNHMFSLREAWFKELSPGAQPTCKENVRLEANIGPDSGKYDAYRKTLKAKPVLSPDASALAMVDAAQAVWLIGKRGGPRAKPIGNAPNDVWCSKLKEVHPLMVDAFQKYADANDVVRAYVDTFVDERDLREVDSVQKKYGKRYRYHFALMALEGKLMMRKLRAELAKDAPDAAVVHGIFASYFAITDSGKALYDAEPRPFKKDPAPPGLVFVFSEVIPKLKRESLDLEKLLGKTPDDKRAKSLDGSWGRVVDAYNEQIRYMNNSSFDAHQK
jgi:hypothetical protein